MYVRCTRQSSTFLMRAFGVLDGPVITKALCESTPPGPESVLRRFTICDMSDLVFKFERREIQSGF